MHRCPSTTCRSKLLNGVGARQSISSFRTAVSGQQASERSSSWLFAAVRTRRSVGADGVVPGVPVVSPLGGLGMASAYRLIADGIVPRGSRDNLISALVAPLGPTPHVTRQRPASDGGGSGDAFICSLLAK